MIVRFSPGARTHVHIKLTGKMKIKENERDTARYSVVFILLSSFERLFPFSVFFSIRFSPEKKTKFSFVRAIIIFALKQKYIVRSADASVFSFLSFFFIFRTRNFSPTFIQTYITETWKRNGQRIHSFFYFFLSIDWINTT